MRINDFRARMLRAAEDGGAGGVADEAQPGGTGQGAPGAQGGEGGAPPAASPPASAEAAPKPWIETAKVDPAIKSLLVDNGFHQLRGEDGQLKPADPDAVVERLGKAYDAAQRKLGVKPEELMRVPAQGQDVAEWRARNAKALNVPEAPDKYGIERPKLPDGVPYDEAFEQRALARFHAKGMPKDLAQEAVNLFAEEVASKFGAVASESTAAKQAMNAELQREWGQQATARQQQAAQAFQHFAAESGLDQAAQQGVIDVLSAQLGGKGIGDARVIKLFHSIAAGMGEGRMPAVEGAGGGLAMAPVEAQARLDAIKAPRGDFAQARARGDDRKMTELRVEMTRLARIIAPPSGG